MKPNCVKIDASRDSMKNEIIDGKKTIFNCPEKSEKQFTIFITFVDEKKKGRTESDEIWKSILHVKRTLSPDSMLWITS